MFTRSVDGKGAASDQGTCGGATGIDSTSNIESTSTAEIDRVIEEIIREHGASAAIEAANRTMPTLDEGAVKGRALWQRVLETAKEVQREGCGPSNASAGAHS